MDNLGIAFSAATVLAVAVPSAVAQTADLIIPAKSVVQIEIAEPLSSKTNKLGDTFAIRLTQPLIIADRTILPAGLTGRGEVTHAAKSGWGGKAGELIVNARYLECGKLRIPLGHFHHGVAGKNNIAGAFVASQVIPLGGLMVSGGEAVIPASAPGTAQVKADTSIAAEALARCAPQSDPVSTEGK